MCSGSTDSRFALHLSVGLGNDGRMEHSRMLRSVRDVIPSLELLELELESISGDGTGGSRKEVLQDSVESLPCGEILNPNSSSGLESVWIND